MGIVGIVFLVGKHLLSFHENSHVNVFTRTSIESLKIW